MMSAASSLCRIGALVESPPIAIPQQQLQQNGGILAYKMAAYPPSSSLRLTGRKMLQLRESSGIAQGRGGSLRAQAQKQAQQEKEAMKDELPRPPNRLMELYEKEGQSPWIDDLHRDWLRGGQLQEYIDRGVRGMTSNPSTFQKAMDGTELYDEQFKQLLGTGLSVNDALWELLVTDVRDAADVLLPLHRKSKGVDGYVSLELAPALAHNEEESVAWAEDLSQRLDRENTYIKVPGTKEGVTAVKRLISSGHSINVTLIFSLARYEEVMEAYISGLEAYKGDPGRVSSVASFFISRVDTEVDKRLKAIGGSDAESLRGKAAIAQAAMAYQLFQQKFSGPRWEALAKRGAKVQRPLWASTSTKDPSYPDTLYIDSLIGPDTVNTMPFSAILAFADHGRVARTIDQDVESAEEVLRRLKEIGVDMEDVSGVLEKEGVDKFAEAFSALLGSLEKKAASWESARHN